jgi:MSHA biogenesis protein MshP
MSNKKYMKVSNQKGFTLVQAIFILVVLGLLGAVMVRLIGVQSSTTTFALQGARAYQAARSGLEWGAAQASVGNNCTDTMAIGAFSVNVTCTLQQFTEGSIGPYDVYQISATATFSNYGSPDFVSRQTLMKVGFPP